MLEKALLESTPSSGDVTMPTAATAAGDDLSAMTEAEQIECALRMSMELPGMTGCLVSVLLSELRLCYLE